MEFFSYGGGNLCVSVFSFGLSCYLVLLPSLVYGDSASRAVGVCVCVLPIRLKGEIIIPEAFFAHWVKKKKKPN